MCNNVDVIMFSNEYAEPADLFKLLRYRYR